MCDTKILCLVALHLSMVVMAGAGGVPCLKPPMLFNFGDGNSDTGGGAVLRGMPIQFPEGRTFFHEPTGRMCDGRLVLDFLCESLWTKYLDHYFHLQSPDFSNGVNFATNGSKIYESNIFVPFKLDVQIAAFRRFHNLSIARGLMGEEQFRDNALYLFEVGQNDVDINFTNLDVNQLVSTFKVAIKSIYGVGGRNFWIHNVGPKSYVANNRTAKTEATIELNTGLERMCADLRSELEGATIVYVDVHAIKMDLIVNSANYGFEDHSKECYNRETGSVCSEEEGARYVSWDGVYYTEAANSFIASRVLSANFSNPPLPFNFFCI